MNKTVLYIENLLEKYRREFKELMPLDDRYPYSLPEEDQDRIGSLKSIINILEDIIEFINKNDRDSL